MAAGHLTMRYGFQVHISRTNLNIRDQTMQLQRLVPQAPMQLATRHDLFNSATQTSCSLAAQKVVSTPSQWQGSLGPSPSSFTLMNRAKALATTFNDTPSKASRPFDASRSGFVIAEGAGLVVLEELSYAQKRGARIYAEVLGYGLSSDAHHMTAPPPDGQGAYLAMRRALKHAKKEPKDVAYVNAHATSTPLGDRAENQAIRRLMIDDGGMNSKDVRISSSKGAIGHLLGAAGSVEAIFTILALHHVPPASLTRLLIVGDTTAYRQL